ncbi:MAG: hypothetical protein NC041_02265 [Bacteroides sp.]|nr:hypothetical protein [Prevotella sp.]MCM1407573.1 adenosine deaminase [Treponema brennaborense]MCM1469277.1 hypothetical protein [Bacteroides sp.]
MLTIQDFINHPKTEAHNHLNLGMYYDTYTAWAGFQIPDFPRKLNGLDEMHEIIGKFTRVRCATANDVRDLLTMSLEAAVQDGITAIEGSVDINFVHLHDDSPDALLKTVEDLVKQFSGKIEFRPELGMGKLFDKNKIHEWAPPLLESGIFKSIDLYGPEVEDGLENFKDIYELAGKLGIKKKAHVGEFSDAKSVRTFVEYFDLEEVQHGIGAAKDDSVIRFLKDRDIRLNITPASNVMLGAVPSLKEHPIKKFYDAGLRMTICTDDLLFFNRSVSQQCVDLIQAGTLSEQEILDILDNRV